jgi:hypothetical protein
MQQPQPAGWADEARLGSVALGLVTARATRPFAFPTTMAGALRKARATAVPQSGQVHGSRNCAMGRMAVNGPQASQA